MLGNLFSDLLGFRHEGVRFSSRPPLLPDFPDETCKKGEVSGSGESCNNVASRVRVLGASAYFNPNIASIKTKGTTVVESSSSQGTGSTKILNRKTKIPVTAIPGSLAWQLPSIFSVQPLWSRNPVKIRLPLFDDLGQGVGENRTLQRFSSFELTLVGSGFRVLSSD